MKPKELCGFRQKDVFVIPGSSSLQCGHVIDQETKIQFEKQIFF